MLTGLNPVESGMLGWTIYYKELDDIFVTFFSSRLGESKLDTVKEAEEYRKKYMKETSIMD